LSNREIASKLGRPDAGIRNLRYRQGLKKKAENETKKLLEQRNMLRIQVSELQRNGRGIESERFTDLKISPSP